MNRLVLFLSLTSLFVLSAVSNALAQDQLSVPVRLAEATQMAMNQRPEIRIESEKEVIAQSKVQEQKGSFLPTIDLQGSTAYTNNYDEFTGVEVILQVDDQQIPLTASNEVPNYELSGQLEFNYNLYAGGRDKALLDEAVSNLDSTRHQKTLAKRKIELEVANAYWELKKAQVAHAIAKRNHEAVELAVSVAQTKLKVHRISDMEYEAVLLKKSEDMVALQKAQRDRLNALREYLHILNIPHDDADLASYQIPDLVDNPGIEANSGKEPAVHPDILKIRSDLEAAAEKVKVERAGYYPVIDLFAEYAVIGRDDDALLDAWKDSEKAYYKFGLELRMNFFEGKRTMARIAQAKARVRKQRLELELKEKELDRIQKVKQTELDTANDELLLAIARKKLEDARLKTAETQFRAHKISKLDYQQKVVDANNAANQVMIAQIDVALARNERQLLVLE